MRYQYDKANRLIGRTYPNGVVQANGFKYVLFSRGTAGVQNMTIPPDPEVGGGAMLRDVVKVGVTGGGALLS